MIIEMDYEDVTTFGVLEKHVKHLKTLPFLEEYMAGKYRVRMPFNLIIEEEDGTVVKEFYSSKGDGDGLCPTWYNVPDMHLGSFHILYAQLVDFVTKQAMEWGEEKTQILLEAGQDAKKAQEMAAQKEKSRADRFMKKPE